MKYLTKTGLLAATALMVAGCGSDSDGSAGVAGGIYGSEFVGGPSAISISAVDEDDVLSGTFGVVNEAGQAAFMTDEREYILWGNVSASLPETPTVDDDDTVFFAPISGNFEVYELNIISGEYERAGNAAINTGIFQDGDYCLETNVDPEDNEVGVGPVSWIAALIRVDEVDDALDIYADDAEFCAEVTFDGIESEPVVLGVVADADVNLYDGDNQWSLASLETGVDEEWCDESDSEGLCIEVDQDGVVTGDWGDCDINGQFSQPSADLELNAFSFSGSDSCPEDGSVGFNGRAFKLNGNLLALFLTGDGEAAYLELAYQEVP